VTPPSRFRAAIGLNEGDIIEASSPADEMTVHMKGELKKRAAAKKSKRSR
jgi:hypothetical protein